MAVALVGQGCWYREPRLLEQFCACCCLLPEPASPVLHHGVETASPAPGRQCTFDCNVCTACEGGEPILKDLQ